MTLDYLANHQNFIPLLAQWYFEEWGHEIGGNTIKKETERLSSAANRDKLPLTLIAIEGAELLGAVQLKYREMSIYPDKEHWLGGVYVAKEHRGKGIARKLIHKAIALAPAFDIKTLYLQTEQLNGGLYRQLDWEGIEQVCYKGVDVLVMERKI